MIVHITDLSDEPLQSQIIRQIRAQILSGDFQAGDGLPSIREFAREHKVSVITVQRAYEHLEREGLISSRRRKGFFINEFKSDEKTRLALETLIAELKPILLHAKQNGLSNEDIKQTVINILHDKLEKR